MNPGRRRGGGLGLFLLATQIMNIGIDNIPPVTLASIALQVAIFLGIGDLGRWFYSAQSVCINSFKVWYQSQWNVLILSALYHADDFHLYYNMVSFLWKGRILERKFKSVYFAYLLAIFTVLTSIIYVGIHMLMARVFDDQSYILQCAVGFSGVIFALKVLVSYYTPPGQQLLMGFIPVPSRMIFWAELVLIQFITPNASFTGHLAGILVGLLYIKGPLKMIMDSFIQPGPSYTYTNRTSGYRTRQNHYSDNQGYTVGGNRRSDYNNHYTGGLSEEEQVRRATQDSLRDNRNSNQRGIYPDLDDLRARRQNRYQ